MCLLIYQNASSIFYLRPLILVFKFHSFQIPKMDKEETTSSETVVMVDLKKIDLSKEPHVDQSQSPSLSQKSTSDRTEENILEEHK